MTQVYFIGAGPGDPELITVKGQNIIQKADLVLYAGSLVPKSLTEKAKPGAEVIDSAPLNLEQTHDLILKAVQNKGLVARVHTGDPSLYGAVREQIRLLKQEGISYQIIPGVTAAFAAASKAAVSFTVPEKTQTLTITRLEGRTPVPEGEKLASLAGHQNAMAIYLSAAHAPRMVEELTQGGFAPHTTIVIAHKVGWPGEKIFTTRLDEVCSVVEREGLNRQTVFLVLPGQESETYSKLYDPDFAHGFRQTEGEKA